MAQVHKRATAKRDLVERFVYLGENAGIETAERNPAAICKSNKNADGSVTSEGKMLVKSASDAIKEQLQNAVTPSKP